MVGVDRRIGIEDPDAREQLLQRAAIALVGDHLPDHLALVAGIERRVELAALEEPLVEAEVGALRLEPLGVVERAHGRAGPLPPG